MKPTRKILPAAAAILVIAAVALFLLSRLGEAGLKLTDRDSGRVIARFALADGESFSITFRHSVNKSDVTEIYQRRGSEIWQTGCIYYGFYYYGVIPADTYGPVKEDVPAVAVMATIVASNKVDEDVIYAFVKGLFDYKSDIAVSHAKGSELDLNTAVSGVSIPWHDGAAKFYKEQGLM